MNPRLVFRCFRRLMESMFLCGFVFLMVQLYKSLARTAARDTDGFEEFGAPKVVAVFRDFDEKTVSAVFDSAVHLHQQMPELDIFVLAETQKLHDSKTLRFPKYDSVRLMRVYKNGSGAFNSNILKSIDYVVFLPVSVRISKAMFASILDRYWQSSTSTKGIGAVALPLAGESKKITICRKLTYRLHLNRSSIEPDRRKPAVKVSLIPSKECEKHEGPALHPVETDCCACPIISSSGIFSHSTHVIVVSARDLRSLPRPWLSPPDISISSQIAIFTHKSTAFCRALAVPKGPGGSKQMMESVSYPEFKGGKKGKAARELAEKRKLSFVFANIGLQYDDQ